MTTLPNTRDALGESWTTTSRRARRIARHSRHAAEDIAGELRTLMSELESTLADGTQADAVALRSKLRKQLDTARERLNDTREAMRERAEVAIADADDAQLTLLDVAPQLAEVALDEFPGAACGDPNRLVVVSRRTAGRERIAEPEPVLL